MIGPTPSQNRVSGIVVDSAIAVHRALGPGLLESIYEQCLAHELSGRGLIVDRQRTFPIRYKDLCIEGALRVDLIVEDVVVLEIKATERILPVHEAQVLTYLKLSGRRLGLLIIFNVPVLKDGVRRLVL